MAWATWNGPSVISKVRNRVANDLNTTADEAVVEIKQTWPKRTGFSSSTMEVVERAQSRKLSVAWGNIKARYVIWVEIGARGKPGLYIIRNSLVHAHQRLVQRLK